MQRGKLDWKSRKCTRLRSSGSLSCNICAKEALICFAFELFRTEPGWIGLCQRRAEMLTHDVIDSSTTHTDLTLDDIYTQCQTQMAVITAIFSWLSNVKLDHYVIEKLQEVFSLLLLLLLLSSSFNSYQLLRLESSLSSDTINRNPLQGTAG